MHFETDLTYLKALHAERTNRADRSARPRRATTANVPYRARLMGRAILDMTRRFRTVPTPSRTLPEGKTSSTLS